MIIKAVRIVCIQVNKMRHESITSIELCVMKSVQSYVIA